MRALVQRVHRAHVDVLEDGARRRTGEIGQGLCVLLGVTHDDNEAVARRAAEKVANLRLFAAEETPRSASAPGAKVAALEVSCLDIDGGVLVVSQFTLYGDTRKGRRPSFVGAARPEQAEPLVEVFVARLRELGLTVGTGVFGAQMDVDLVNDGPLTLLVEV